MNELILVLGMAAVTFFVRYPLLALVSRVELPQEMFQNLRYVPVAVLTAIITPALLLPEDELAISLENEQLVAGLLTIFIAWRSKNLLLTIVLGMVIFLGYRILL